MPKRAIKEPEKKKNELFFRNIEDAPKDGFSYLCLVYGKTESVHWENGSFMYVDKFGEVISIGG